MHDVTQGIGAVAAMGAVAVAVLVWMWKLGKDRDDAADEYREIVVARMLAVGAPEPLVRKEVEKYKDSIYALRQWELDGCFMLDDEGYCWNKAGRGTVPMPGYKKA